MNENVRIAIENIEWADEHLHETLYDFRHLMLDIEFSRQEMDTILEWVSDKDLEVDVSFNLSSKGFDYPAVWNMYIFLRNE